MSSSIHDAFYIHGLWPLCLYRGNDSVLTLKKLKGIVKYPPDGKSIEKADEDVRNELKDLLEARNPTITVICSELIS